MCGSEHATPFSFAHACTIVVDLYSREKKTIMASFSAAGPPGYAMGGSHTRVSYRRAPNFLERVGSSLCGSVVGIFLIFGACILLFFNEVATLTHSLTNKHTLTRCRVVRCTPTTCWWRRTSCATLSGAPTVCPQLWTTSWCTSVGNSPPADPSLITTLAFQARNRITLAIIVIPWSNFVARSLCVCEMCIF